MGHLFSVSNKKDLRRFLRRSQTFPEARLWEKLRSRRFFGLKFRRQHNIGRYIVDFYCPKLRLAIEVDGPHHFSTSQLEYDQRRDAWISSQGIIIVRYTSFNIMQQRDGVLKDVATYLPRPLLAQGGAGGGCGQLILTSVFIRSIIQILTNPNAPDMW